MKNSFLNTFPVKQKNTLVIFGKRNISNKSPKNIRVTNESHMFLGLYYRVKITSGEDHLMLPTHVGVQICVRYRKHLRSLYSVLTAKSKTDPLKIYQDVCDLLPPWNPETVESQRQHRTDRYSRPWKRFNVNPTLKRMDKQLLLRDVG